MMSRNTSQHNTRAKGTVSSILESRDQMMKKMFERVKAQLMKGIYENIIEIEKNEE